MTRQAARPRLRRFTLSLFILGAFFIGASPSVGQFVSGTIVNESVWENNETNSPPHWYVSEELGAVSNGNGRVIVALFSVSDSSELLVASADLTPITPLPIAVVIPPYVLGSGLAAGDYRVRAWIDGNGNSLPDTGEPMGVREVTVSGDSPILNIAVTIKDDTDNDDLEDWWEVHWFGDLDQTPGTDFDNDGLTDGSEYGLISSNVYVRPDNWDTDGDGADDAWEIFYGLNPTNAVPDDGRFGDPDSDTIINFDEYMGPDGIGWRKDDNGDGIAEFTTSRDAMNPNSADSDQDGARDDDEFLWDLTHPTHSMSSSNFYPRSLQMSVGGTNGVDITDPTGTTYAFGNDGGTVEFWIRPGAVGDGIIYGFTNNITAGVPHFRISLEDYRPRMDILNGSNIMASVGGVGPEGSVQQLESNEWTHVACVIAPQNNSLDLYVDGVLLIAQKSFIKPNFTRGAPTICQGFTDGYIDELRIWSYPRPAADIEYWAGRIYPAPGYVREWAGTASGRLVQMYDYVAPRPLIGYFRFDDGGPRVENFAFINYGLYPNATSYYLGATIAASVTTDQAVPMSGSDDADGDGLPEWWVEIHNLEKYREYYSSAYGPIYVPCPDDAALIDGFEYFRSFIGYGSIGTHLAWKDSPDSDIFHAPKTSPDFYCGDRSSYTRYVYLFAQPLVCPLNIYTPGMSSTIIYVNGTRVTTAGDEANTVQSYDLAQYMQLGRNQIHVECESEVGRALYDAAGNIASAPYTIADYQAYDPSVPDEPFGCENTPYQFRLASGKFDADLTCNGVPMVVRGDESRADPRSVWHCQVWSEFYARKWTVPIPDQENRAVPGNVDYGVPMNAERDNNPLDPESADDDLDAVYEFITGTNPRDRDSNNNGVGDGDEDFDMDGLVNREEQRFGSDPWLPDSDDDGLIDGSDVGASGHPAQSLSPQNNLSICLGGAADDVLEFPIQQRFALSKWTVEGWIRPDADELDGGILMQRSVSSNGVNYEVGLTVSNTPYARYVSIGGVEIRTDSPVPVPADGSTWTHLAASYYDRDLTLYVDGTNVAATTGAAFPALYAGGPITQNAGSGFKGCIDELRLWGEERTPEDIILKRDEVLTGLEDTLVAYYRFDDSTSYSTNPPPLVGTSANNGTNGAAATVPWAWGQVEDNVLRYSADWQYQWEHAASFSGNVNFSTNHIIVGPPRLQVYLDPDDAIDAGAAWSHNGGAAWNDSGYLETRLSPGDYEISFKTVEGWIAPDSVNATLVRGQSTTVTGVYQQTASLTVIIDNNTQVKTHATWSIDGGINSYGTGSRLDGLAPGTPGYDIIFSDISTEVPGWDPPDTIHVELLEGEERTITTEYTPVSGGLQITFTPDEVPTAARWRVSGNSNWFGSGEIVTNLNYGEHTVEYNTIEWWEAPADEILQIEDSTLLAVEREWTKLSEPTRIGAILTPSNVVVAGARWQMGGVSYNSGENVVVDPGTYVLSFNEVDGYLTPLDMSVTADGSSVTVTGAYYRADILGTAETAGLRSPRGVAATLRYLYVADSDNHRIRVRDMITGTWSTLGSLGTGLGQFNQPFGVAVADNGDLWVADTGNHRVQRRSATTGAWAAWGSYGAATGQLNAPYDLDVDAAGNVYVADYHNSRVQKLSGAGAWSIIVTGGTTEGKVRYPSGIAVDGDSMVYVSDYDPSGGGEVGRIQQFDADGVFVAAIGGELDESGGLNRNLGLCVDGNGLLQVANTYDHEVLSRSTGGVWQATIAAGILNMPHDVSVDAWGNIVVSDTGNNRIILLPVDVPGVDTDGDGVPDTVEAANGTSATTPDSDYDGFDDKTEIVVGTDPNNPMSFPALDDGAGAPSGDAEPFSMPELDYDGDGKSDLAAYGVIGGQGLWYLRFSSTGARLSARNWGDAMSVPVRGDFNGDGVADMAVFRSNGWWYVSYDYGQSGAAYAFGDTNSIPVPGDYDGDGSTDLGVYQRQTKGGYLAGQWFIYSLSKGYLGAVTWGNASYLPAPGDYDGDGQTDIAVHHPTAGGWYVLYSSAAARATARSTFAWGTLSSLFLASDTDGSGAEEFVAYDTATTLPNARNWYMSSYENAGVPSRAVRFGHNSTLPVAGDFDGDGVDDFVVYLNGQWYIWKSATGGMWAPTAGAAWTRPIPQFHQ